MNAPSPRRRTGHSLVEVALAVGIIGFCLLAILGLFSVGQMASQKATRDTALAAAASQIMSLVRSQISPPDTATYYFDNRGQNLAPADADKAAYMCEVSITVVPETELPNISTYLSRVKIEFAYPANAAAANETRTTFHATLPKP